MDNARILVVEDESGIRRLIERALEKHIPGAAVCGLESGGKAIETIERFKPHLVILDWVLGKGQNGVDLCREIKGRRFGRQASVMIISGRHIDGRDRLESIARGGDAYLSKPFSIKRLIDYSKALLKKSSINRPDPNGILVAGDLVFNRQNCTVLGGGKRFRRLPKKLFNCLWLLAKNYPKAVETKRLIRDVWKNQVHDAQAAVAVSRLKKYLAGFNCSIICEPGQGYRLVRDR
ncbi:MAG: response regulator transcription factor [Elusimicrobia bacterium]|nr:response regulator transcription factor [Elusimicrobiota bacterium]